MLFPKPAFCDTFSTFTTYGTWVTIASNPVLDIFRKVFLFFQSPSRACLLQHSKTSLTENQNEPRSQRQSFQWAISLRRPLNHDAYSYRYGVAHLEMQRSVAAGNLPIHTCRKYGLMKGGARASKSKSSVLDRTSYCDGLAFVVDMQTVAAEHDLKSQ